MSESKPATQDANAPLYDTKSSFTPEKVKEHFAAIIPFQIIEKIVGKPLRIRGVAITTGMSRNFNIYTSEELKSFASKLVNSPVYIEHVSVENAVGKVTKTDWDGHALWYEAEIYESEVADKIRKGLVQHVSVGADYEAIDLVDGKVPHGLHNAELSLVAVPGIPETNIQVIEKLEEKRLQEKLSDTEGKLAEAQKTIEQLTKPQSSSGLVKDQPKTMPISEVVAVLEGLLPSPTVEHSTLGMQRECQEIRGAIHRLKAGLA
ncbi:MAG: hypothetical protein NWE94_06995 [Candidatus Bathyarchaeota archaeon]|nr:hypothetical protein [Candidatus Bathyarchaeota archaeon]